MFDLPERIEKNRVTGATVLNLGFMSKTAADHVFNALEGRQTYMNFTVCRAPCPGGPYVSISTTYADSPLEILAFAFSCLAGEPLAEAA